MQLAHAARGQSHLDAGNRLRHRQFAHCHLPRPSPALDALSRPRKRILEWRHRARIRFRPPHRARVCGVELRIGRPVILLVADSPGAVWGTETDAGTVPPFKYPFAMARKRIESGGWTRQVTVRELPVSKSIAGVEMRLTAGGVRELHWHVSSEWAIMLYGTARITAVDAQGKSFVSDVGVGDLWLFPPGVPHSIQGLGPDGCQFLLVFDDGNFNEFETFLLT